VTASGSAPLDPVIAKRKEAKEKLVGLLSKLTKIAPKYNFVTKAQEDLLIDTSDLVRLNKLCRAIDVYNELPLKNGGEAVKNLKLTMSQWEMNGRP
jgi:hypothetical protein